MKSVGFELLTKHQIHLFLIFVISFWVFSQWSIITKDILLGRDDLMLVDSVKNVVSLTDYFQKISNGSLHDIQPVRDISYWVNIKLLEMFSYGGFHLFNLIIGLGILVSLSNLLKVFNFSSLQLFLALSFVSLHPIFNNSLAWVAARKHLLSVYFIVMFFLDYFKNKNITAKSVAWSVLSFLSQPITIFIPMMTITYDMLTKKKKTINFPSLIILVISLVLLITNHLFYNEMPAFFERSRLGLIDHLRLETLYSLFRVFTQIFLPISFAVEYDPENPLVIVGLSIFFIMGFLIWVSKKLVAHDYFLLLSAATCLFPVVYMGPRDNYLIIPLLVSSIVVIKLIKNGIASNLGKIFIFGSLCFLASQSLKFSKMWVSDIELKKMSMLIEGGPFNQFLYAYNIVYIDPDLSHYLLNDIVSKYPYAKSGGLYPSLAETYYLAKKISVEDKVKYYDSSSFLSTFELFFSIKLYQRLGDKEKANNNLIKLKESLLENKSYRKKFNDWICSKYYKECQSLNI